MADGAFRPRLASAIDGEAIAATLSAAFDADPLWSWALPDEEKRPGQYEAFIGLFIESALPNGWVWIGEEAAAVAVWTPPGKKELSEEAEAKSSRSWPPSWALTPERSCGSWSASTRRVPRARTSIT